MIRNSKTFYTDNLSKKLKISTVTSKDLWSTLKSFISPLFNTYIHMKVVHILRTKIKQIFRDQTLLDDENEDVLEVPLLA